MSLLVLSQLDVNNTVESFTPTELEYLMAKVFHILSSPSEQPSAFNPSRTSMPTPHHTALFMPARIAHDQLSGTSIKVVSVPKDSTAGKGLPGSTLVLDEETGVVKAIVNSRGLTALRNAAGSLLSAHLCIPPNRTRAIKKIAFFGAGKQIEAHINLFCRAYSSSMQECMIINRTVTNSERVNHLLSLCRSQFKQIVFTPVASVETEEVQSFLKDEADIIICATSSHVPLFPCSSIRDGTHIILIGSYTPAMHEVDRDLIHRVIKSGGRLVVDSWEACSIEAGELIDASVKDTEVVEIGNLVSFDADDYLQYQWPTEGQGEVAPVSIFKSVGVGLQDVAIACAVVRKAERLGLGTKIEQYD